MEKRLNTLFSFSLEALEVLFISPLQIISCVSQCVRASPSTSHEEMLGMVEMYIMYREFSARPGTPGIFLVLPLGKPTFYILLPRVPSPQ